MIRTLIVFCLLLTIVLSGLTCLAQQKKDTTPEHYPMIPTPWMGKCPGYESILIGANQALLSPFLSVIII